MATQQQDGNARRMASQQQQLHGQAYSWAEPAQAEPPLRAVDHFSSLLFGGSAADTLCEITLLLAPFAAVLTLGASAADVASSMPLSELATFFCVASVVRRVYNAYLEAVWFGCPEYRTQPPKEHQLKSGRKDLCGRELAQLQVLGWHNKMTMLTQFALSFGTYYALPGFYPAAISTGEEAQPMPERCLRLILNHYVMALGMYWGHRALHSNKWLWTHIHSIHHWAKHPLSRKLQSHNSRYSSH